MIRGLALMVILLGGMPVATAGPLDGSSGDPPRTIPGEPFLLGPPDQAGPVIIDAHFQLHDINEIDDETEVFEFTGVLTLTWKDSRQAFDPAVVGVNEKVYQGAYQFNEISTGWYPQVVLVNEAGLYQKSGVVLRVQADGTSTLIETLNAVAESGLSMRRFPFDTHRLEAVFEVLGFNRDEIILQTGPDAARDSITNVHIPQWTIKGINFSVGDRSAFLFGHKEDSSTFVVSVDVERRSFFVIRLVVFPLVVIVLLSFSVFWMDRSSLGDRISVSFIGILTGVAYQMIISENLPHISYFTLIHGFLNLSFLTMCATVVINLAVGAMDKRGEHEIGDRIDRRCRRIFPLAYFGLNLVLLGVVFLFFF